MNYVEIDNKRPLRGKILEINNIAAPHSEWWSLFNGRFSELNGCGILHCDHLVKVKIPIVTRQEAERLGL